MTSSYLFHGDRLDHSRGHGHLVVSVAPTLCVRNGDGSPLRRDCARGRRLIPLGRRPRHYAGLLVRVVIIVAISVGLKTVAITLTLGVVAILTAVLLRRRRLSR